MSEGYKFFKASVALSEVKKSEPKMSDDEALDYVVEHMDVDKVRFTAWLKTLGENMAPPKKEKRFHSPEEIQDYEDRNPQHYA